jgi:hypothetical protein
VHANCCPGHFMTRWRSLKDNRVAELCLCLAVAPLGTGQLEDSPHSMWRCSSAPHRCAGGRQQQWPQTLLQVHSITYTYTLLLLYCVEHHHICRCPLLCVPPAVEQPYPVQAAAPSTHAPASSYGSSSRYAILKLGGVRQMVEEGCDYTCPKRYLQVCRAACSMTDGSPCVNYRAELFSVRTGTSIRTANVVLGR